MNTCKLGPSRIQHVELFVSLHQKHIPATNEDAVITRKLDDSYFRSTVDGILSSPGVSASQAISQLEDSKFRP
jgi:hypothetical protein